MEGCVGMPTTTSKLGWDIGSAFNEMGKCRKYSRLEEDGSGSAVGGDDVFIVVPPIVPLPHPMVPPSEAAAAAALDARPFEKVPSTADSRATTFCATV
ncbi:hypothetical protein ACHAXH_000839 [Discostella pseudostelligera]